MGIKLDWEVESEGGWNEVGEDPKAVEARRRRARRVRNVLLVLLALLLVIAAIVGYRLFTVGQQVREALKATVSAETLALRIGDREAFLMAQSTLGGWQQVQEQTFQQYQEEGARVNADGQIVQMDISADQARVTLREVVDGKPYNVMWFYQRDAGGWKHVAPDPHFWGNNRERHTSYFEFSYYSEDQALVDTLAGQLDSWWKTACDLTQCSDRPPSVDVKIEPDRLAKVGWASYDANTLIIPSPLLGRFPANGKPDPLLMGQIADLIAYRWAEFVMGKEAQMYSDTDWMRSEVHWWLRHSFDPTQPPAPLLDPLVQAYGKEIVVPLTTRVKRNDPLIPVLQAETGANAADLPVGWELYLTYRLRAEMTLIREGKETEAILLYRDPERPTADAAVTASLGQSNIDTIQVIGLRRYGDLFWAETTFSGVAPADGQGSANDTMSIFVPFRLLGDRWVHTVATEPDWGPAREERGPHIILRYHDLDALTVTGLQAALEQAYNQVSADMGAVPAAPVLVEIMGYDPQGNALPFEGPGLGEEQPGVLELIPPITSSPYSKPCVSQGTIQESLRSVAVRDLVTKLAGSPAFPLGYALQRWELARFGFAPVDVSLIGATGNTLLERNSGREALRQPPESLEALWLAPAHVAVGYATRDYIAAKVLVDLLVELYGEDVVARLAPNLSQASSMDDWLYISLGIHTVDIEAEWRERAGAELNSTP